MAQGGQTVAVTFDGRTWRGFARLLLESVVAGTFVSVVLGLAVFIVASQANAATPVGDVKQGTLILRDATGVTEIAPLVFTDVHMDVSGMTARVRVTQHFVNPAADWREGVYVFPLPEKAAVDHLDMRIGERVIQGQIKERGDARRTYEAAKTEGKKASLVEQERPNMFTTNLANIGPSEEIAVGIEYQQTLTYDAGSFALRFPMAITPRYIPGTPIGDAEGDPSPPPSPRMRGEGWAEEPTDQVPDADRITPPFLTPGSDAINPISLDIDLDAGFPLAKLTSPYHAVRIEERGLHRFHVSLADGLVPAARDFELVWTPDVGSAPAAALLTEERDGRKFALLMVLPPAVDATTAPRAPREITYIVDTSGSMEGVSMDQAKEALLIALDRLQPGDRFNVIEFNSVTRTLYSAPMPVDDRTLATARKFVRALRAQGGTEMLPALTAALSSPRDGTAMRQVVFLTDGAVGNENELLKLIQSRLGDRRLFTIGIGPAPNTFFLKKAAEAGRGTFTFIGDVREVKDKMAALFRKIESPVLTDIDAVWPGGVVAYPGKVPDLYAGEPIVLSAELANAKQDGVLSLTGVRNGKPWSAKLALATPGNAPGIGVLWARDKIESLMDAKRNGAPPDEVKRDVIAVAMEHHLVSAYTSLVAVDITPTAPMGITAKKTALPQNVPEGLTFGG
ncbi:MAG TPA: marine proteobacterial sortase target protein, partial [Casimicrobiaceae bacterium]|nr:marine proteobacterial sortase target protein [Casimicrobiaceae bacterium]